MPGIAEFGNRHTLCDERIRQHPGIRVARTPGGSCINAQLLANTSRTSQFHCVDISAVFLFPYHRIRLKFTAKNCRFSGFLPKHMNRTAKYAPRSEEHTTELQSLMRISYAVICLKKKTIIQTLLTINDKY